MANFIGTLQFNEDKIYPRVKKECIIDGLREVPDGGIAGQAVAVTANGAAWVDVPNPITYTNVPCGDPIAPPQIIEVYSYTAAPITPILNGYDSSKMALSGDTSATNVGDYTLIVSLIGDDYWSDTEDIKDKTLSWSIKPAVLAIPTITETYTYNGSVITPTINHYDASKMTISGDISATRAGNYTISVALNKGCVWSDTLTDDTRNIVWTINRAYIPVPSDTGNNRYTGSTVNAAFNNYDASKMTLTGTTSAINCGTYTAIFSPIGDYYWNDTQTQDNKNVTWELKKAAGSVTLSPSSLDLIGSGATGTISVTRDGDGAISVFSSATNVATVSLSGTTVTVTAVNLGNATITVNVAEGSTHFAASTTASVAVVKQVPIGGRIYYDDGDNGATYTFYDASGNKITDTSISGLANAVSYIISGTPTKDRFYVYDNTTHTTGGISASNGLVSDIYCGWAGTQIGSSGVPPYRTNTIGSGKLNTNAVLTKGVPDDYKPNIWAYIKACRDNNLNGCNDWYINSYAEQDKLKASGLVSWYSSSHMWSSVEYDDYYGYLWRRDYNFWDFHPKSNKHCCFAGRSF